MQMSEVFRPGMLTKKTPKKRFKKVSARGLNPILEKNNCVINISWCKFDM